MYTNLEVLVSLNCFKMAVSTTDMVLFFKDKQLDYTKRPTLKKRMCSKEGFGTNEGETFSQQLTKQNNVKHAMQLLLLLQQQNDHGGSSFDSDLLPDCEIVSSVTN